MITPTAGTVVINEGEYHRRVIARSYGVVLCEIGGSRLRVVRLDRQVSMWNAKKTALLDNPGWRFKEVFPLTDRDFEERG